MIEVDLDVLVGSIVEQHRPGDPIVAANLPDLVKRPHLQLPSVPGSQEILDRLLVRPEPVPPVSHPEP